MVRGKICLLSLAASAVLILQCGPILAGVTWFQMAAALECAKREGVYQTPDEGLRALAHLSSGDIERVEISSAGPNAFDGSSPRVRLVTARVWAASRGDGKPTSPRGYGAAGSFFLRVQDG